MDKAQALDCYTKGVGAVCERRFLSDTQTCPYGWGLYGGICMHVEAFRGNFQQARKYCNVMKGSDLAAPDDEGAWVCGKSSFSIRKKYDALLNEAFTIF